MAIQVNGTQVIGNSRELTNIASVDATTVAAMTAAGVGGSAGWEYVTTITNSSTVSYIDYDFDTTYNHFMFLSSGWRSDQSYTYQNPKMRVKFKTNSTTLSTTMLAWQDTYASSSPYGDTHINLVDLARAGAAFDDCPSSKMEVWDVKDSTTPIRWESSGGTAFQYTDAPISGSQYYHKVGSSIGALAITGIRFYSSANSITSGTKIKIWGMK